ncbi:helix-turn-helix transcriptional regulator [Alistipes sp.]|uniref:helix-turn-helix transcriptional regulator n=1 Tax=Alistipes sp. TaxID=1872444 RepID=UPI003AEF6059
MKRQRRNTLVDVQIAVRLKGLRYARGLTQEDVRYAVDMNIARIESGRHSVSLGTLADLSDFYDVPFEELFRGVVTH